MLPLLVSDGLTVTILSFSDSDGSTGCTGTIGSSGSITTTSWSKLSLSEIK
ncbi:hypothetical protein [Clostridium sp. NSJ-49]|uniref:hypothetical protein n=1 Tax=Clostridium TaxID=1485 RepID=UPI001A9A7873|nr:hypothetical protein [Clostridium sp. NSJ-49]